MAIKKKGSKLNKSETAQVRFDPILKMAAELAAAKERRSMSSYIELAVELAAKQTMVARDEHGTPVSAWQVALGCWHQEPMIQTANLADRYPDLVSIRDRRFFDAKNRLFNALAKDSPQFVLLALMVAPDLIDAIYEYVDEEIPFEELIIRVRRLLKEKLQSVEKPDETHSSCSSQA